MDVIRHDHLVTTRLFVMQSSIRGLSISYLRLEQTLWAVLMSPIQIVELRDQTRQVMDEISGLKGTLFSVSDDFEQSRSAIASKVSNLFFKGQELHGKYTTGLDFDYTCFRAKFQHLDCSLYVDQVDSVEQNIQKRLAWARKQYDAKLEAQRAAFESRYIFIITLD